MYFFRSTQKGSKLLQLRSRGRNRFHVQLFQSECHLDLGNDLDSGTIPIASKIIKSNSASNLFVALRNSAPWFFTDTFRSRLTDARWQYAAYHCDSLSANLLMVTHLSEAEFPEMIIDRVPCLGHQLNIVGHEVALSKDHTNSMYCLTHLTVNQSVMGELMGACRVVAREAPVHRMVPPPPAAREFLNFLIQHTPEL